MVVRTGGDQAAGCVLRIPGWDVRFGANVGYYIDVLYGTFVVIRLPASCQRVRRQVRLVGAVNPGEFLPGQIWRLFQSIPCGRSGILRRAKRAAAGNIACGSLSHRQFMTL